MASFLNGYALVLVPRPLTCIFADDYTFLLLPKGNFGVLVAVKDVELRAMLLWLRNGLELLLELKAHRWRG